MKNNHNKIKLLFLVWTMPPSGNAMAVITRNLLKWFNTDEVIMMGQIPFKGRIKIKEINHINRVKIPNFFNSSFFWRFQPFLEPISLLPFLILKSFVSYYRYRFNAIYVTFPNSTFLFAGYILSKILGIPLYPHFHNLYPETRKNILNKLIAERFQKIIFSHSKKILSMSEGMTDFFREKYEINNVVSLLHPINYKKLPNFVSKKTEGAPYKIGLTGNVNNTVLNPIRKIMENIGNDSNFKIILHSPSDLKSIKYKLPGLEESNFEVYDANTQKILLSSLRACSILILTLDNRNGEFDEEDFMTQFPTRTIEMLISGTPIILLCPQEYYLARFFMQWNCGKFLDLKNVSRLKDVILELCSNEQQKEIYVKNAFKTAENFNGKKVANTLRQVIKEYL